MANQIDIILQGQNKTAAAFQQVRRDLDGIARTAKSTNIAPKLNIGTLSQQINEVEGKLAIMRARAAAAPLSPGDLKEFRKLEAELKTLERLRPNVKVDINTSLATARVAELKRQIDTLQKQARVGSITVEGVANLRQAQGELNSLQSALAGTQDTAGGLASVLTGRLAGAFTVAGAAAAAMKLGGLFMEFGALGETVQRSEKYFTAFSGSASLAAANLAAMQRATEGALSTQEAMNAGASILGMGLAKNADELEQFARMAVLLGGNTRTATEAINEFQLLIANQSILRLDTFGISGARVRERIEELQAATADLTREQAFMQAVMEEGTRKMQQLEAEGVRAGTSAERLAGEVKDLRAELAELVRKPYTIVIERVIQQAQGINDLIGGFNDNRIALNVDEGTEARLEAIASAIQRLEEQKQRFNDGSDLSVLKQGMADIQIAELRALQSQLTAYGTGAERVREKLDDYLAAALEASGAQAQYNEAVQLGTKGQIAHAKAELQAAQAARDSALAAYQAAEGYARQGAAADLTRERLLGLAAANREVAAAQPSSRRYDFDLGLADRMSGGSSTLAPAVPLPGSKAWNDLQAAERARAELLRATNKGVASSAGRSYLDEMTRAGQEAANRIAGFLSQGMSNAEGLFDLTPDMFAPGANGAFENIFRALDVAKLGDASPWAAQLGLTQEEAAKIGADFQRGIFSEGVMSLIDTDALVNEAKMADLAQKSKDAFVKAIAQKAGVGTTVVGAMFGLESAGGTGQGAASGAQKAVDSAMQQVAGALGDTVRGSDFAGKMIGYGRLIWGNLGNGIVEEAKASTTLQQAIDAMVAVAIARRTGGSVGDAVRGGGGQ